MAGVHHCDVAVWTGGRTCSLQMVLYQPFRWVGNLRSTSARVLGIRSLISTHSADMHLCYGIHDLHLGSIVFCPISKDSTWVPARAHSS